MCNSTLTGVDGAVQLAQARIDLRIHLPLPPRVSGLAASAHSLYAASVLLQALTFTATSRAKGVLTRVDGAVQLAQASVDLRIHLPLPRRLLGEGVSVGAKRLADLHQLCVSGRFRQITRQAKQLLNRRLPCVRQRSKLTSTGLG